MLRRYSETIRAGLLASDLVIISAAWLGAYALRFYTGWFPAPPGDEVPPFRPYALLLGLILPLWIFLFRARGLYEPQRTQSILREASAVLRATGAGVLLLVAVTFFARSYFYSRMVIGIFAALASVSVVAFRANVRVLLHAMRRRGYNLRYVLVVGSGEIAEGVIDRLHEHPEAGLRVIGVVADPTSQGAANLRGVPLLAGYGQLKQVLASRRVDQLMVALPRDHSHHLEKILADLDDEMVSVRLVPDLRHILTLRTTVEDLDGLPVIGLRESPFVGWAAVRKRVFDASVASLILLAASPILGCIALAVWASSGRPIFFGQERMGLDGRVFRMWKFRTMVQDAEQQTGPVWTVEDDPRRTGLGAFLRRYSLDELPQLWNVVRGDMSLVGPRPERPVFIEQFRREIPGYMLRHKVRAGMTGWAQVHGWRGDTSLHERIEHDIYYIQNWSLGLDLRILATTLGSLLRRRNAY